MTEKQWRGGKTLLLPWLKGRFFRHSLLFLLEKHALMAEKLASLKIMRTFAPQNRKKAPSSHVVRIRANGGARAMPIGQKLLTTIPINSFTL